MPNINSSSRKPRRYFKITEITLMKKLAAEGRSQYQVAKLLNRSRGAISQAAKLYKIKFHAKPGPPPTFSKEEILKRRAESCRRWRYKNGSKPRIKSETKPIFKSNPSNITRFDDPRVMIKVAGSGPKERRRKENEIF